MSLYPLGITRSRDVPVVAEKAMVGQVAVRWVLAQELAAAVDVRQDRPQPLQHAAALNVIHRRICVLPMRFQTVPWDEGELRSVLESHRDNLLQRLDRLDGTCEMGVRIRLRKCPAASASHPPSASPYVAYLDQRRAHYQTRDSFDEATRLATERLLRELGGTYREWRMLTPSPPGQIRAAFLVEQELAGSFARCLEAPRSKGLEEQRTLLGPWPPYSFA